MNKKTKIIIFFSFLISFSFLLSPRISSAADFDLLIFPDCFRSQSKADLSWIATPTAQGYEVWREVQGGVYARITTTFNQFFTDSGIASDKSHKYKIKAGIYWSEEKSIPARYCPPYLNNLEPLCQDGSPRINLSWEAVSGNLNTYNIWRKKEGGSYENLQSTLLTSHSDGANLEGTSKYYYYIEAVWQSPYFSSSSKTQEETASTCSPILSANSFCENSQAPGGPQINLSWTSLLGVEYYQIYRKVPGESQFSLLTVLAGSSYVDKLVESFSQYEQTGNIYYYVKAKWPNGEFKNSLEQQISIPRCQPFLDVEAICDPTRNYLSWTKTQGTQKYVIWRATGTESFGFHGEINNPSQNYFTDGLGAIPQCQAGECTYRYKIEARAVGWEEFSSEISKTIDCVTIDPPWPPPDLEDPEAFCFSGDSRIRNSWQNSDNVYNYILYKNNVQSYLGSWASFTDTDITPDYPYTFKVRALVGGGTYQDSTNEKTIIGLNCITPSWPPNDDLALQTECGN